MKILFLGIITGNGDEGAKNIAINLSKCLTKTDELFIIHQREIFEIKNLINIKKFNPDLILSVHGPSNKTILLLLILKNYLHAKVSIIATQPQKSYFIRKLIKLLNPNIIFVQSNKFYNYFMPVTNNIFKICNGVDKNKFYLKSIEVRNKFRLNNNIDLEKKILLHIGPINKNRNLELLVEIQKKTDWQIVVIGSTTAPFFKSISNYLLNSGIILITKYFEDISEAYSSSDAYIFPTIDETGSIEIPLTVLEAIACHCPVVSTPFRGLKDFFPENELLKFFNSFTELESILSMIGNNNNSKLSYVKSWSNISTELKNKINDI